MKKVKVLIVDDSAFMRKLVTDFLSDHPLIEVIGTARDGKEAVEKVKLLKPDVVTMDVEMPIMNGLESLKEIMEYQPLPVVMLSSTTQTGTENAITAMQYGAVDLIAKPAGAISLNLYKIKDEIIEKILLASRANLTGLRSNSARTPIREAKKYTTESTIPTATTSVKRTSNKKKIVCIGTSTGGPRALQQVLTQLPATIDAPIIIVQHMPKGFTKSLATRLDASSKIQVKEAENGDVLKSGVAYIAPGGFHLKVVKSGNNLTLCIDESPVRNGHRPSVDVMFESVVDIDYEKIAVVMTGMGSDGAEGMKLLKKRGNTISIAESEETSVVFGMPKAIVTANLADEIANVDRIASTIMKYVE